MVSSILSVLFLVFIAALAIGIVFRIVLSVGMGLLFAAVVAALAAGFGFAYGLFTGGASPPVWGYIVFLAICWMLFSKNVDRSLSEEGRMAKDADKARRQSWLDDQARARAEFRERDRATEGHWRENKMG